MAATLLQTAVASTALTITTWILPSGSVNAAYSQSLAASGGTVPYSNWTVSTGALPAGLTLSSAGLLSGTPTKTGASSFKVTVADSAKGSATASLTLTITAALAISTSTTLTAGKANVAYTDTLAATGGTPPYSGGLSSGGAVPQGLKLSPAGVLRAERLTGGGLLQLYGRGDRPCRHDGFGFVSIDHRSRQAGDHLHISVTGGPGELGLRAGPHSDRRRSSLYRVDHRQRQCATGIDAQCRQAYWGSADDRRRSYSFTLQVTDSTAQADFIGTVSSDLSTIAAALLIATPSPLPARVRRMSLLRADSGGQWRHSTLCEMGFDHWYSAGGTDGQYRRRVERHPHNVGRLQFYSAGHRPRRGHCIDYVPVDHQSQGMLAITTVSPLPPGLVGANYSQSMTATGGKPPYTWAANSRAPGLSFSPAGTWSGTAAAAGIFTFSIQVVDTAGSTAMAIFQLTISPTTPVTITTYIAATGGQCGFQLSRVDDGQLRHFALLQLVYHRRHAATGIDAQHDRNIERHANRRRDIEFHCSGLQDSRPASPHQLSVPAHHQSGA